MDIEKFIDNATQYLALNGAKILLAIVLLWIGWKIVNMLSRGLRKWFDKANYDEALETFIHSLVTMALRIVLVVSCAGIAGFPTTSLVAIIGAAGLAIGLALSGTLQNFAGGVLILILKPFKIGDFIETEGKMGTVKSIQIFNTIINTPDNKRIILPNGPVSTGALTNFSAEPKRRIDFVFGIGYEDDIDHAKKIIRTLIDADERADQDPEPLIVVSELADFSVNLTVRVWADAANYWGIHFDLLENVKKTFDKEGISIPYPQRDIHVHQES